MLTKRRKTLDAAGLEAMALRYVERFGTSRARLARYLGRKLRERDWVGAEMPEIEAIATRFESLGYIDDQAFAEARSRGLSRRGYGPRRIAQALDEAGIDAAIRSEVIAEISAWDAAIIFARKRRLGPFGPAIDDRLAQEKAIGTFARAGHRLDIARLILAAATAEELEALRE